MVPKFAQQLQGTCCYGFNSIFQNPSLISLKVFGDLEFMFYHIQHNSRIGFLI